VHGAKVTFSMNPQVLRRLDAIVKARVFRTRSEAIQTAVEEKLARLKRTRLARECAKLSAGEEQRLAEEGLAADTALWPEY
jgi:Arc/MetJ-type ribon-helix-helix transcriptional regulator